MLIKPPGPVFDFPPFVDFLGEFKSLGFPGPTKVIGVISNVSYFALFLITWSGDPAVFLSPILSLIGSPLVYGSDPAQSVFFAKLFFTFAGLIFLLFDFAVFPSGMSAPYPFKLNVKKNYSFFAFTVLMNEPSLILIFTDAVIGSLFP